MLECNFLDKRICILTENADGDMYMLKADNYNELVNDWYGECEYVPSNDAKIYFACLDGVPISPFLYNNFESLALHIKENWVFKDVVVKSYAEQADEIVKKNPSLAWEISRVVDRENYREDIISQIKQQEIDVELSEKDIDMIISRFDKSLSKNDSYMESYWMTAQNVIDEFIASHSGLDERLNDAAERSVESNKEVQNKYYKFNDGMFAYFVNKDTGKKKFTLDENDVEVEPELDDFYRER